jgi:predicted TPR repeat methyltransferase
MINSRILVSPSGATNEPNPQEIDKLISLFKQSRYAELETLARAMTVRFPYYSFGWKAMGLALLQQGRTDEALDRLQKVIELSTGDADLHNIIGNALAKLNRLSEAEASYRLALELNQSYTEAHHNLGNTLSKLNRLPEAEASYRRALELNPDLAEAYLSLGDTQQRQKKLTDAEISYRQALKLNPDYAKAQIRLGFNLIEQDRLTEAEASFFRALQIEPDNAESHYNLGNTLKKQGKLDAAAACFRTCLEIDPKDLLGARLLLAALGVEPVPLKASEAHLQAFYSMKAEVWDRNLGRKQTYHGAELVAQAIKSKSDQSGSLVILDAGCGTGHVGLLIRDLAIRLDGVDMSSNMLEKARTKRIYDNIYLNDLESFMRDNPNKYDAITCAATLIHFGDLTSVFSAARTCLRDNGLFVFTVFQNENEKDGNGGVVCDLDGLAKSGCYAHGRGYVSGLAETIGFDVEMLSTRVHEYRKDNGMPVMCFVVVLRSRPRLENLNEMANL